MARGYLSPPVLIGLAIICLVTAATLLFNSFLIRKAKEPTGSPSPSPIVDVSPAPNDTGENWKTYTNEEYGFELWYPPIWGEAQGSGESFTAYFQTSEYPYSMIINAIQGEKSFDGYLARIRGIKEWNEIIIGNRRALQSEISNIAGSPQIETFIDAAPKVIVQVLLMGHEGITIDRLHQLNNQILSTFKFIDQAGEGAFCGGIAGLPCPSGFECVLDGNYPDAGGKCVKT